MQPRRSYTPYVWRAGALTCVFAGGIVWTLTSSPTWAAFGVYASVLSFFHLSEFVTIAVIKPRSLRTDSFLLNHSREYHIAAVASWAEFLVEGLVFPSLKSIHTVSALGLGLCLIGELIRKGAMFTAGSNFSHTVEYRKETGHMLVTKGLYAVWRHPSYVGWFYWAIGTQIILLNPICLIGYACAAYDFFKNRVREEEQILIEFFGDEYVEYKKKVPCGFPFLSIQ